MVCTKDVDGDLGACPQECHSNQRHHPSKGHLFHPSIISSCPTGMTERASYRRFVIMVLIITVRPQTIFLVVRRVTRYALVRLDSLDLGVESFLF